MFDDYIRDFRASDAPPTIRFPGGTPKILFPRELRLLAREYTQLDTEFAWHGTVLRSEKNEFLLTEFIPTEQEASPVHVTLLKSGNERLLLDLATQGAEGSAKIKALRFWGQSHHGFGVTPSCIDDRTFERVRTQNLPWFIQGIFNRRSEVNFKMFLFGGQVTVENVPWFPVDVPIAEIVEQAASEIATHLSVVPTPAELIQFKAEQVADTTTADSVRSSNECDHAPHSTSTMEVQDASSTI